MTGMKILGAVGVLCVGAAAAFAEEAAPTAVTEDGAAAIVESDGAEATKTLASCLNAKLLKQGASVDYTVRRSSGGKNVDAKFVYQVGKPKKFNGVTASEVNIKISYKGFSESLSEYYSVKGADLLKHGLKSGDLTVTYTPAEQTPSGLKPKGSFTQKYVVAVKLDDGKPDTANAKRTVTFDGVETLKTSFGKIKACKVVNKTVLTVKGLSQPVATQNAVEWYAAEGKYQGFKLKVNYFGRADGANYDYTLAVLKFNAYNVK